MNRGRRQLTPEIVGRLTLDAEPWLSCDDCFDLVDRYVERLLADPGYDLPAMRAHLTGCTACAEEAESLLLLAAEDAGIDPAAALLTLPRQPRSTVASGRP